MRILGQAIAVAAILLVRSTCATSAELLPPERTIAEAVDHYVDATLGKEQ